MSINFSPFEEVARLLYESAFVAERYSGIRTFLEEPHVRSPSIAYDSRVSCVFDKEGSLLTRFCFEYIICVSLQQHIQPVVFCLTMGCGIFHVGHDKDGHCERLGWPAANRLPGLLVAENAPAQQGKAAPTPAQIAGDVRMERVTAAILSGAPRFSAADVYDGLARLAELAARARIEFTRIDFLLVPSALHHYLITGTGLA